MHTLIFVQSALVVSSSTVAVSVAHHYKPMNCLTREATGVISAAPHSLQEQAAVVALRTASSLARLCVADKPAPISTAHRMRFLMTTIDQEMSVVDIFEAVAVLQRKIIH
jgi:hypothetical protein